MSIIYRKVARDLLLNKTRTLLVVLSTAVGILALGLVISLSDLMGERLASVWEASRPAHVAIGLAGRVDDDTSQMLLTTPGVAEVEPVFRLFVRWKRAGDAEWRNGTLTARRDYARLQTDLATLKAGTWPRDNAITVEYQTMQALDLPVGSRIQIKTDRYEREMPIVGAAHDLGAGPPQFGSYPRFFVTLRTAHALDDAEGYNRLNVRLAQFNRAEAEAVAKRLEARLKKMDVTAYPQVQDPKRHPMQETLDTVLLIMGVIGVLSLALSAFLVVNTVSAVLAQQVSQIGMMKAVGATAGRVMRVYLGMVLIYGAVAVVVAVPLAALAAHVLADKLLGYLSLALPSFRIVPRAMLAQLVVGLLAPVLAALWPVLSSVRITVREAIASYGLGADFGRGWLDRFVTGVRGLPRPLALSLRNTFRRKGRVVLTQLTLITAGVLFMTVMSSDNTLNHTMRQLFATSGYDVEVDFNGPQYFDRAEAIARTVPGVVSSELWEAYGCVIHISGERKREALALGVPPDSIMMRPTIIAGRWLRPGDENVIVINQKIAQDDGLKVGDRVNLNFYDKGDSTWQIVGVQLGMGYSNYTMYIPRDVLGRTIRLPDRGHWIFVKTDQHDPAYQVMMEKRLVAAFETNSMSVVWSDNASAQFQRMMNQFNILTYLLLVMAVLAGLVGSLGLMGTMSINVLERSKEIGVMRAIGALSPAVIGIFVVEGVILGLLSAAAAIPISYPVSRLFTDALGKQLFKFPLDFRYSLGGLALWIVIVVALSALASLWPATRAARMSVRETLAYE